MKTIAALFVLLATTTVALAHPGHESLTTVPAPAVAAEVSITVEERNGSFAPTVFPIMLREGSPGAGTRM